ncbi:MAG: serine hydrolase [Chitinophagaceae bacterium]
MHTTRRNFIKTTGVSTAGIAFMPGLSQVSNLFTGYFPISLPYASPESKGVSSKGITNFIQAANASGIDWHSFMLVRHGHVVAEGWWKPFEPTFKHTLYSLSKSFTSSAIGLLVKEGKLKVDEPVISFFKDEIPATPDENLKKMKIKSLLTMNTGHAEDTMPKLRESNKSWTTTFLEQSVKFEPGSHFLYNTGATYMLGAIVHKVTGETLEKYLAPRLFQPLEITGYDWEVSPQGLNTAGYGLRVKTEDIAKFGQLYLQKGKWNGNEILTEDWVDEATRYETKSQEGNGDWSVGYGYQFWRCKPGGYRADGAFGQFCFILPEQDAVMVITGESFNTQKSMTIVWDTILPAMQANALPENPAALAEMKKEIKNLALPVAKGSPSSALSSKYNGKKFTLSPNEFDATEMKITFSKETCSLTTNTAQQKETTYKFGLGNWFLNQDTMKYIFPVAGRFHMPSKLAGSAAWVNENTLQLSARFVEAMHGDKITCSFEGDKITVSFMNSVAENSKTSPEKRMNLVGSI